MLKCSSLCPGLIGYSQYLFIRIATTPKGDKAHTSTITDFLRTKGDARVLIILSMHSSSDDGKVEWVNSTQKKPGQRELISGVSYLILCVAKFDQDHIFIGFRQIHRGPRIRRYSRSHRREGSYASLLWWYPCM